MSTNFQNISSGINLGSLAADPSGAKAGDFYFNSTSNKFRMYDGTSWADVVTGTVVSGANQTLSNLTSPVAFNQNLTPDSNATRNVGSSANLVNQVWTSQLLAVDPLSGGNTLGISKRDASSSFPEASNSMSVASGSTSLPISIQTTNSAANDANATTDVHVLTGNKTSGTGNSGSIVLKTGTSAGGTRGTLEVDASLMNVNNAEIRNVLNPTLPQSAATKVYVDTARQQFIANGLADNGTTGWATYADAAGTSPVDGTGGTAAITFTTTTLSPLSGNTSFILTKGASNRQGQGASYDFTIDNANLAKVQEISFDYIIDSGTFIAGNPADRTSAGDSSVTVWIYDVTNSTLIQPSSYRLYSNSTATPDKFSAYFQTASNSTSYRLILHIGRTETTAYTLKVNNIEVQPSEYVYGTPITDWQTFTYNIGASTTPPSQGSGVSKFAYWRRVGDSMELRYQYSQTGAGSAGSGNYLWPLPAGYSMDFNKADVSIGGAYQILGTITAYNGSFVYEGHVQINSANTLFAYAGDATSNTINIGSTFVPMSSTVVRYAIHAMVPIQGWSSSIQMSDSADTRVMAAQVSRIANQSIPTTTNTVLAFDTINRDTHGVYTTNGRYTTSLPGFFNFSGSVSFAANASGARFVGYRINGGTIQFLAQFNSASGSFITILPYSGGAYLNAGDYLEIIVEQESGNNLNVTGSLYIARESGPSAIAATETIAAKYTSSSGQTINNTNTNIINFSNMVKDTHGAVTTGASWKFTAPASGEYRVSATTVCSSPAGNFTVNGNSLLVLYKNGVEDTRGAIMTAQVAATFGTGNAFNGRITLNAGDFIDIRFVNNTGQNLSLGTLAAANHIEIERVGL